MASPVSAICFVAHYAYGAMSGGHDGHAGGVERQISMTARWLAARGHDVSLVVWNEGQPQDERVDGVRVIQLCREGDGWPVLRFLHPRWTSLWHALSRADADVYYHNCAEATTGQIALWCQRHGTRFVYSVASDPECDPALPMLALARERALFRYGLRHADRILLQTQAQRESLLRGFGLTGTVLPMPCEGPSDRDYAPPDPFAAARPRVVWVGRISAEKRIEWLIDIAALLPELAFDVAGAGVDGRDEKSLALAARAAALPNVTLLGKVPRSRMPDVYGNALALLCTSAYEGFPNTFLEAWSHGIPVVSTVDPDNLIATRGLGAVAPDPKTMAAALRALLSSPASWHETSVRARGYFCERHTPERALPLFEQVLVETANQRKGLA
jgi:glycosyltransferase involved in cell wall biosynthesis